MFKSLSAFAMGSFMAMNAESLHLEAPNHDLTMPVKHDGCDNWDPNWDYNPNYWRPTFWSGCCNWDATHQDPHVRCWDLNSNNCYRCDWVTWWNQQFDVVKPAVYDADYADSGQTKEDWVLSQELVAFDCYCGHCLYGGGQYVSSSISYFRSSQCTTCKAICCSRPEVCPKKHWCKEVNEDAYYNGADCYSGDYDAREREYTCCNSNCRRNQYNCRMSPIMN